MKYFRGFFKYAKEGNMKKYDNMNYLSSRFFLKFSID